MSDRYVLVRVPERAERVTAVMMQYGEEFEPYNVDIPVPEDDQLRRDLAYACMIVYSYADEQLVDASDDDLVEYADDLRAESRKAFDVYHRLRAAAGLDQEEE